MSQTVNPPTPTRRLRAAVVGLGLDGRDSHRRILTGDHCLVVGGSDETHGELIEIMLRLESELERRGKDLAELDPSELADIACRIDSPELLDIAFRIKDGLDQLGFDFAEATADLLTDLGQGSETDAGAVAPS